MISPVDTCIIPNSAAESQGLRRRGGNGERRSRAYGDARSHWRVLYHIRRDEILVRTKYNPIIAHKPGQHHLSPPTISRITEIRNNSIGKVKNNVNAHQKPTFVCSVIAIDIIVEMMQQIIKS